MLYAYIGTALVVAVLVGAVTLCVIWLSRRISSGIREKTVDVISAYDVLLEKRSRELAQIEEAIRQKTASTEQMVAPGAPVEEAPGFVTGNALVSAAERFASSSYRDASVGRTYRKIRDAFRYDPQEVLDALPREARFVEPGPATTLLNQLSYDTIYRLSTLGAEEQRKVLEETLDEPSQALLQNYCSANQAFSAIGFYDYLQAAAALEPQRPRLRVFPGYRGPAPEGVDLVEDPDICEGFQIEAAGSLYDYCIKGRELS